MPYDGSEDFKVALLHYLNDVADQYGMLNVRNNNVSCAWTDIADFDRVYAFLQVGQTWNGADDLDTVKLEQATSSAGAGKKDITTSGADTTYNYDETYAPDASGDFVVLTCRAEDLDSNGGFHFVRVYAACADNTGEDDLAGFMMLHQKSHREKQVQGATAAATDTAHYVSPHSAGGL